MKFTISSMLLNAQLQSLAKVITGKNTIHILDCFLFSVSGSTLTITASDGENVMNADIPLADCEGEGEFAVATRTILDSIKELAEQPLLFEVDTTSYSVHVEYANGVYNFVAENADEYPRPKAEAGETVEVVADAAGLSSAVSRSIFAAAQDELRPVMNGIFFDFSADCLAVVATDGRKLVRNRLFTVKSETPISFVMPKKPATLLRNVLPKCAGDVHIKSDGKTALITYSEGSLMCRLFDGRYPNYASVIPQDNPYQLLIDRKLFIGALRRVLPFASESSELLRLHLETGFNQLSAEDIDFATSAKESLTCDYTGATMDLGFKGSAMMEILSNLDGDNVSIHLADPSRAGIVEPAQQPENADVLMLIMPMLLND